VRNDIQPGAVFPDYQLPDHTGAPRRLSELQGEDPLRIGRISSSAGIVRDRRRRRNVMSGGVSRAQWLRVCGVRGHEEETPPKLFVGRTDEASL
jgi:hypothetical protein